MNELRKKRKDLQITQLQAANSCGVSLRTYQTYEETAKMNATYNDLVKKLTDMGIMDGTNFVISVRFIKQVVRELFSKQYPEIECAYLFGSYARGEATGKSDVDIVVVLNQPMGLKFYGIAGDLEERLNKKVNLLTYEQIVNSASMLKDILVEGIKIYG